MTTVLALLRLLQLLAASALCGSSLFCLYGWRPAPSDRPLRLLGPFAAAGAAAAVGWLMAQAGVLFDDPAQALSPASVWSVVADTGFGPPAAARAGAFVLALAVAIAARGSTARPVFVASAAIGAAAAASFAWTGHGAAQEGPAGALHLAADVLHLLAACVWIGALFCLARLVCMRSPAARPGLVAFSGVGPATVAVLVFTGLVNGWFLVGPRNLGALWTTPYGLLLLIKLGLFAAMLGLAGLNRWVLTPRLGDEGRLRASVLTETLLAVLVLGCVSLMGVLAPPAEG